MDHNSSLVSLSIPKEVAQPIVAAKIQEAVTAALGGADKIVASVIHQLCNQRVDSNGNVSRYDSDNKMTWMDYHITELLQKSIKDALKEQLSVAAGTIKEELIKQLQSKKGASQVASILLAAFDNTLASNYTSKIEVKFENR